MLHACAASPCCRTRSLAHSPAVRAPPAFPAHCSPVPLAGFYNLNGTMADACPAMVRQTFPTRDVCIVGCLPAEACVGSNQCSEAYQSKAPYFRCADCAKGYYKSAGDCIKCPDSPGMLFVGTLASQACAHARMHVHARVVAARAVACRCGSAHHWRGCGGLPAQQVQL
ncbi:hypothetical protein EON62_01675 [archaeon]|nr:MAG: hypothetical protein EON62_01675 [archaeon]